MCGVLFQFYSCMLLLENLVLGWLVICFLGFFFKSVVFDFKGEKI